MRAFSHLKLGLQVQLQGDRPNAKLDEQQSRQVPAKGSLVALAVMNSAIGSALSPRPGPGSARSVTPWVSAGFALRSEKNRQLINVTSENATRVSAGASKLPSAPGSLLMSPGYHP